MQKHDTGHTSSLSASGNCVVSFFREYRFTALFGLLYGAILYALMMTQQLTNTFDGSWLQNYHIAGSTELSSGRWLLLYIDELVMGLHADPITSLAALLVFVVGFLLVLDLFQPKSTLMCCLCLGLFISSTLIPNVLSYRYTSLGYALSYFFAALGIYVLIRMRRRGIAIGLSGVLLGLSMSCYQAYLAVFFVVAVFYAISQYAKAAPLLPASSKRLDRYPVRIFCAMCVGALFYIGSLSLCLALRDVSLSGYNGIGQISARSLLSGLPRSALKTYRYFIAYFFGDKLKISRLQPFVFYVLLTVLFATLVCIAIRVWKTDQKRMPSLLLLSAAIPVAANAYMLLAGDKLELQMTAGLAMLAPLTVLIALPFLERKRIARISCVILCIALIGGSSMQGWIDQEAMYEGQNACDTMLDQVITDLKQENLLSADYEYFFIGVPEENPLFYASDTYYCANAYAQMGRFWTSASCSQVTYRGLIRERKGLNIEVSSLFYENIASQIDVSALPEFPQKGYITMLDEHTVLIKICEYKAYSGDSKYVLD